MGIVHQNTFKIVNALAPVSLNRKPTPVKKNENNSDNINKYLTVYGKNFTVSLLGECILF
jgi:hypothetical protein